MKTSGVQLAKPIRPPGRQTRARSDAAVFRSGENITRNIDSTASKLASPKGSLGVSHLKRYVETVSARPCRASLEQGRNIIGRGDLAAATYCREGGTSVAGSRIEEALIRVEIGRLGPQFADELQDDADHRIVPVAHASRGRAFRTARSVGTYIKAVSSFVAITV
jgi:hypothetical protein